MYDLIRTQRVKFRGIFFLSLGTYMDTKQRVLEDTSFDIHIRINFFVARRQPTNEEREDFFDYYRQ